MSDLAQNLKSVRQRIANAASRSGRDPGEVKLVAVSKTHPAKTIHEAIDAGISVFGENKVQEAVGKIEELGRDGIDWHLIGHLQSNKARKAVQLFDVIHSIDSIELAERLERICIDEGREALPVLIQVDLAAEETKSGIAETELPDLIARMGEFERLKLKGLMILPPFFEDPEATRPFFKKLREIRDRLLPSSELSMGMSHDFEVAIEEGATVVRVGTAIFGERDYN
jgi:pyridoxal phosphate enzyme (YggS family)